jgi:hypothetical protein
VPTTSDGRRHRVAAVHDLLLRFAGRAPDDLLAPPATEPAWTVGGGAVGGRTA